MRYTPRRDNGETGRTRACRRAEVVVQTHPVLTSVVVRGEAVEGSRLTCEYDYMGGVEGETELQVSVCRSSSKHGAHVPCLIVRERAALG